MSEPSAIETLLKTDNEADLKTDALYRQLVDYVQQLINEDFERLVHVLYRVDVSEEKLKTALKDHGPAAAAKTIAALLIERQAQKIRGGQQNFPAANEEFDDLW